MLPFRNEIAYIYLVYIDGDNTPTDFNISSAPFVLKITNRHCVLVTSGVISDIIHVYKEMTQRAVVWQRIKSTA